MNQVNMGHIVEKFVTSSPTVAHCAPQVHDGHRVQAVFGALCTITCSQRLEVGRVSIGQGPGRRHVYRPFQGDGSPL